MEKKFYCLFCIFDTRFKVKTLFLFITKLAFIHFWYDGYSSETDRIIVISAKYIIKKFYDMDYVKSLHTIRIPIKINIKSITSYILFCAVDLLTKSKSTTKIIADINFKTIRKYPGIIRNLILRL